MDWEVQTLLDRYRDGEFNALTGTKKRVFVYLWEKYGPRGLPRGPVQSAYVVISFGVLLPSI
jgi:hypothetical protein